MRLFDNSAIKIDLFPGKKDKRNGKTKNATIPNPPCTVAPSTHNATQQVERDEPKSTVKAAKSMQNMDRPTYQRPNTSRSFDSYATGGSLVNHAASGSDYDHDRPSTGHSERSNTSRTYQQPWSSPTHTEHKIIDEPVMQQPSQDLREKSTTSAAHDSREPHANISTRSNTSERRSTDQRRSRADIQDEWEADQRLRTNIPRGAPHSTSHALKHKRSKADMIRATENMARTLSRSPHRSPANRRQLGAVDEVRPSTSSSNGSSRLQHHRQNSNTQLHSVSHGSGNMTSESCGTSKLSQGQTNTSSSEANTAMAATPDQSSQATSNTSDHSKHTDQKPQCDGLSPTKVPNVAKKQGKAFHSTIKTAPPLSMEPNRTTWSPTSSMPRRKDHSRTRTEQKTSSATNAQPQARDAGNHAGRTTPANAGANAEYETSQSSSHGTRNSYAQDVGPRQAKNRSSIDNKRSDHLSLAQRENLANSQYADQQPQAVLKRSNGKWASQEGGPSDSSDKSETRSNTGHGSSAGESSYSDKKAAPSQPPQNVSVQQPTSFVTRSRADYNNGSSSTGNNQNIRTKSSLHDTSSTKNYSRPGDSSQTHGRTLDCSRPSTSDSSASVTSVPSNVDVKSNQPKPLATQEKDFAHQASSGSSSSNRQQKQKQTTITTSGSQRKYVDAGNSTTSPFQTHFGRGKNDPRKKTAGHDKNTNNNTISKTSSKKNKFSNRDVVKNNLTADKTTDSHPTKKKPSLTLPNHTAKADSPARKKDAQASGRAKVVCINNGGSTVVDTPMTSDFKNRQSERKDSGQSDSLDFGGKSTYSHKEQGSDGGYAAAVMH